MQSVIFNGIWYCSVAALLSLTACTAQSVNTNSTDCNKEGAGVTSCSVKNSEAHLTLVGLLLLNGTQPGTWLGVQHGSDQLTRLILPVGRDISSYSALINRRVKVIGTPAPAYLNRPQISVQSLEADTSP